MTASDAQLVKSVNSLVESVNSLRTDVRRDVRRLSRLFEAYVLRPGPGRPRHRKITQANRMRDAGKPWREIYRSCLPDPAIYPSADAYQQAKENLKKAVTLRLKRAIPRKPGEGFFL